MKKYIFVLLPLMALLCVSCLKEISLESIDMEYVDPANGVIPAEGGEITIKVISTHSFQLTSPSSAFSFLRDGKVPYDREGVALVETTHTVNVSANEDTVERMLYIEATHLRNSEISTSRLFLQPAKELKEQVNGGIQ